MPLLLAFGVLISLQIFWRVYNVRYMFQIVNDPSYLYFECTLWYWLSKGIKIFIEVVGCGYYYFNKKYNAERLMKWMMRLHQSCCTFTYVLCIYFMSVYGGIVDGTQRRMLAECVYA